MAQSREERKLLRGLSARASQTLAILQANEQEGITVNTSLATGLACAPITFVVFACLGTIARKEELCLSLSETIFFKKFRRQAKILLQTLQTAGIPSKLLVILPDLEPRRTWGWQIPQDELSGFCRLMIDDSITSLPEGWTVHLWSDIEAGVEEAKCSYDEAIRWSLASAPELILHGEREFFQRFAELHPDIVVWSPPDLLARKQIAAYAHEGRVLETRYPNAILLQADTPISRKDAMFNLLRREPLAIAHPFTR